MSVRPALVVLSTLLAGCAASYRTTLLPTAESGGPPPEYHIEIPDGYEVRSVDYDAALVGIASGENTTTSVEGKGVVAIYAVERATGREVVLVYDDVQARPTPSAIIRIEASGRSSSRATPQ